MYSAETDDKHPLTPFPNANVGYDNNVKLRQSITKYPHDSICECESS